MCVILEVNPGITVPFEKLDCACDINKHGFGIAYVENNEIKIIKNTAQPNDPKVVADYLQKLKQFKRFVHLRHATVGQVNEANCHPFVVLAEGKKAVPRIAMMHNGTINSYTPPTDDKINSDTLMFNKYLLMPLAERVNALLKTKFVIDDFIFKKLVDHEAGLSVVVVFDAWGNVVKFNENRGKQFEGWWASNDYSFHTTHHRSSHKNEVVRFENWRGREHIRNNQPRKYRGNIAPWEDVSHETIGVQMASMQSWDKELSPDKVTTGLVKNGIRRTMPYHENDLQFGVQMREVTKHLQPFTKADK